MTQKKTTQKTNRRFKPGSHSSPPRFCYLWIWIVLFFIAIQYVSTSGLLRPKFDYGNFTSSASSRARFRRDTSKLDNAVRNLGHLARVANGIALEIGLVDGSIKPGDAVSELLLMGDLQLDDIVNLNHDSIEKVLTAMSQKIQTDQQVEKLEQRLMRMEDVRAISPELQNLKEIPGLKEFETSFKAVKDLAPHKANLTEMQNGVNLLISNFVALEGLAKKGFTEKSKSSAILKIGAVSVGIEDLQAFQTAFEPIKELIGKAKKMSDNVKFIEHLATENKFRTSEAVDYTVLKPLLLKNFEKVREDFQAASDSQKEFESILKLVQSRSPLHRQTYKHTAGFPRGSEDLKELEQSIEDPSIISRISNGDSVKTDLKAAFESFKNLEKEIGVISSDWKGLETQYKTVNDVVSRVIELGKLSDISQSISGAVDALVACDKGKYPTSTLDETLAESIKTLSNKVGELDSFDYLGDFSNLDSLKKDFDTNGLATDQRKKFVTDAFNKWKTDETLKTFVADVKKLDDDLKYFLSFLDDPTKGINLADVTKHLQDINKPDYTTFLKCVNEVQIDGFPVREMIKFIQNSKKKPVPQGAKDAITKIIQSGTSLTSAQNVAGKFKDDGKLTPKIEVFKSSFEKENYEEVSRKLGLGVQGLAAILKVRTAKIDGLVGMTERILNEAKTDGLSPEQQKSLQQLKEVKTVLDSIDTFLQTSKGLQALRRKRNAGFESFQEVLKDAANVQGATVVVTSLREATNALKKLKVNGMEIDTLASLDLDFAKFNMADAVSSLISMDKFFKKYIALLSGAPGPGNSVTTKPGQKGPSASADSLVEATTKSWSEKYFYVYIIIGLFLILILVAGVYFGKPYWEKWRKKKVKQPDPPNPPTPRIIVTPTPAPPAIHPNPNPDRADNQGEPGRQNIDQNEGEDVPRVVFPHADYVANGNQQGDAQGAGGDGAGAPPGAGNGPNGAGEADGQADVGPVAGGQEGDGRVENEAAPDVAQNAGGQGDAAGGQADAGPEPEPEESWSLDDTQELNDPLVLRKVRMIHLCSEGVEKCLRQRETPEKWSYSYYEKIAKNRQKGLIIHIDKPNDNLTKKQKLMSCHVETMAHTGCTTPFINCNRARIGHRLWYVGQHPLDGKEDGKDDTREEQWSMIFVNDIAVVVILFGDKEKLAEYFPSSVGGNGMKFGRYQVITEEIITGSGLFTEAELFTIYDVLVADTVMNDIKKVRFVKFAGWSQKFPPKKAVTAVEIIKYAKSIVEEKGDRYNVLINCKDGLGPSGTLITIMFGIHMEGQLTFFERFRYAAVQTPLECVYAVLSITAGIMQSEGIGYYQQYHAMMYFYENMCKEKHYEILALSKDGKRKNEFVKDEITGLNKYCKEAQDEWEQQGSNGIVINLYDFKEKRSTSSSSNGSRNTRKTTHGNKVKKAHKKMRKNKKLSHHSEENNRKSSVKPRNKKSSASEQTTRSSLPTKSRKHVKGAGKRK